MKLIKNNLNIIVLFLRHFFIEDKYLIFINSFSNILKPFYLIKEKKKDHKLIVYSENANSLIKSF